MLRGSPRRPGCLVLHALRGVCAGVAVAVAAHFLVVLAGPNFRTVVPGRVYRSGQLSPARLDDYVRRHGIRTVVNLRGCCVAAKWYQQQADATARLDVAQEDLSFSATRMPSRTAVRELIEILERSERPLVIHCHQGADRTGLASVVVQILEGVPLDDSERQLGLASGHVALGRTAHVDRFFAQYRAWLRDTNGEHSPSVFRAWASEQYCPDAGRAEFSLVSPRGEVRIDVGQSKKMTIRCHNSSPADWRFMPGANAGIHGQWRLLDRDERPVAFGRTGLRHARVSPGASIDLDVALPPLPAGRYVLYFDLADEQHAAFLQLGNEVLAVAVEVS